MPRSGTTLVEQCLAAHAGRARSRGAERHPPAHRRGRGAGPCAHRACRCIAGWCTANRGGTLRRPIRPIRSASPPSDPPSLRPSANRYLTHLRSRSREAARITDKLPGQLRASRLHRGHPARGEDYPLPARPAGQRGLALLHRLHDRPRVLERPALHRTRHPRHARPDGALGGGARRPPPDGGLRGAGRRSGAVDARDGRARAGLDLGRSLPAAARGRARHTHRERRGRSASRCTTSSAGRARTLCAVPGPAPRRRSATRTPRGPAAPSSSRASPAHGRGRGPAGAGICLSWIRYPSRSGGWTETPASGPSAARRFDST